MSESSETLRKKINEAANLESVVRTMKAIAASNIIKYEKSASALDDYYYTIKLGLNAYFRRNTLASFWPAKNNQKEEKVTGAIVFGADQGLTGQFNEVIVSHALEKLSTLKSRPEIWAVGEGIYEHLTEAGLPLAGIFSVPNSLEAIAPLVGDVLLESETRINHNEISEFYIFYNSYTQGSAYKPVHERLLPLDDIWLHELSKLSWPTKFLPEVIGDARTTLLSLIHEYLFVAVFRACTESLAAENASRLATTQRADKNISELLEDLNRTYQTLRQNSIDEELFDVISGFENVSVQK
ncbi:MAG TPA: F0F1 ATP synthase subunit gamma [Desulfitobacteriaceae bacterium]|nr:F0F1 ATP synthase subunit gamma [Desulfitobacteriaceae bacterium]